MMRVVQHEVVHDVDRPARDALHARFTSSQRLTEHRRQRLVDLTKRALGFRRRHGLPIERRPNGRPAHLRDHLSETVDVRHHRGDRPPVPGGRRKVPQSKRHYGHEVLGHLSAVVELLDELFVDVEWTTNWHGCPSALYGVMLTVPWPAPAPFSSSINATRPPQLWRKPFSLPAGRSLLLSRPIRRLRWPRR